MILLILWRLLLIVSVSRYLCLFVFLSRARSEILLSIPWGFRSQEHLMPSSLRLPLVPSSLRLLLVPSSLRLSLVPSSLRLPWVLCLRRLLVFSPRLRAITAARPLSVGLVRFVIFYCLSDGSFDRLMLLKGHPGIVFFLTTSVFHHSTLESQRQWYETHMNLIFSRNYFVRKSQFRWNYWSTYFFRENDQIDEMNHRHNYLFRVCIQWKDLNQLIFFIISSFCDLKLCF